MRKEYFLILLLFLFLTACSSVGNSGRYGYRGNYEKFENPITINPDIPKDFTSKTHIELNEKNKSPVILDVINTVNIEQTDTNGYLLKSESKYINYFCSFDYFGNIENSSILKNDIDKLSRELGFSADEGINNIAQFLGDEKKLCKSNQYLFKTRRYFCGVNLRDYEGLLQESGKNMPTFQYINMERSTGITNIALGIVLFEGKEHILNGFYMKQGGVDPNSQASFSYEITGYDLTNLKTGFKTRKTLGMEPTGSFSDLFSFHIEDTLIDVHY